MKMILLLACLLPSIARAARSGPEALRSAATASFASMGDFKLQRRAAPAAASRPAGMPAKAANSEYVHVSGSVSMNGNGNYTRGSSIVWVNFSGYGTVTDASGRVTSNYNWFNRNAACTVSGGWVNCHDWGQWSVQFYKDGRFVGTGNVSGSINSTTYAPNGFFTATSYVSLSGDVLVTAP